MTHWPDDDVILYDGVCIFCSRWVRFVIARDTARRFRFTPIQSAYGRQLALAHGIDPDQPTSFLFLDGGRVLEKSAAILALLRRLGAPWSWLAVVGVLPEAWLDGAYDWLAANRYRLMGKRSTCMLPTPEQKARFVLEQPPR